MPHRGLLRSLVALLLLAFVARGQLPAHAQTPPADASPSVAPKPSVLSGFIPRNGGFGLIVYSGGSSSAVASTIGCAPDELALWATDADGAFVPLVPASGIRAVNASFDALFPGGVMQSATALIGRCTPPPGSGIYGRVTLGPITPVCRIEIPCERAYEATLTVNDSTGMEVARATSGPDGGYRIMLPPGRYTLVPLATGVFPQAPSQQIEIANKVLSRVDVQYSTGIR